MDVVKLRRGGGLERGEEEAVVEVDRRGKRQAC